MESPQIWRKLKWEKKSLEVCKEELMETEGVGPNQSTGDEKRGA